jgi:penicillin-binding protein 1A
MLPVKNILREYLRDDADEDEAEAEAEAEEKEEKENAEEETKEEVEEVKLEPKKKEEEPKKEQEQEQQPKKEQEEDPKKKEAPERVTTPVFTGLETTLEEEPAIKEFDADKMFEEEVKILDGAPEPLDGFEDLTSGEILTMEFEELS